MATSKPEAQLSPREFQTVRLLVDGRGMPYDEIAASMSIAIETVKRFIAQAMDKTESRNRVGLALWFVERFPSEELRKLGYLQACAHVIEVRRIGQKKAAITKSILYGHASAPVSPASSSRSIR